MGRHDKKPHQGKHDDGSFESGEGAAEAILDEQLNKPLPTGIEGNAGSEPASEETQPIPRPADPVDPEAISRPMTPNERAHGMGAPDDLPPCPASDMRGDKTPAVFVWNCCFKSQADVEAQYAGRKVAGLLVTGEVIRIVRDGPDDENSNPALVEAIKAVLSEVTVR